jgi:hypothetical protein
VDFPTVLHSFSLVNRAARVVKSHLHGERGEASSLPERRALGRLSERPVRTGKLKSQQYISSCYLRLFDTQGL